MNRFIALIFAFVLFISACGGESAANTSFERAQSVNGEVPQISGGGGGGREAEMQTMVPPATDSTGSEGTSATERKIIRNAELTLEADSPEETLKRIIAIAESNGGFIVEARQATSSRTSTKSDTITATFRVSAAKFSSALAEMKGSAGRVLSETVSGQDITEEFIDIEARLKAHRALEAQFMEIMKRANTVEDALKVQTELAEVRGEIERIEGRKRYLENNVSLSTIKVAIHVPASISAGGPGFLSQLTESIDDGLQAALNFILGLVTLVIALIPFILFILLPLFFLVRYFWKRKEREKITEDIFAKTAKEDMSEMQQNDD